MVIVDPGLLSGEGSQNCQEGGRSGSDRGSEGGSGNDPGDEGGGSPPWLITGSGSGSRMEARCQSWFSRCLISGVLGTTRGRVRRVGTGLRRNGLPSAGESDSGSVGALVLAGQWGLLHASGPVIAGHRTGVVGCGILVATCWISALASRSCFSRADTRSW